MLVRNIYINGAACISAQYTFDETFFDENIIEKHTGYRNALSPDYKQYLNATASRRFSRLIKMSLVAAQKSISMAAISMPEAIITGTGLGCLEDTEKFLLSMIESNEMLLSPTAFIQSTHNTISGQIAMMLSCNYPNYTYSSRYFSFESSLLDGLLMLGDNSAENVMVNAADEITPSIHTITKQLGIWDRNECILNKNSLAVTAGEGVVSLILSKVQNSTSLARIAGLKLCFNLLTEQSIEKLIHEFLEECNIKTSDIDVVILGMNGEAESDQYYNNVSALFSSSSLVVYKHLFGEMFTSSAFSYWLSAHIIHKRKIPLSCLLNDKTPAKIKNILIYNQFRGKYHSLCLMTNVEV